MASEEPGRPIRLGLVGIGKIARDQHVPALAADPRFAVVATADPAGRLPGVPTHQDIAAMLDGGHALDAVSLCTPASGRHALAAAAIAAGLHVMLEKPPATTLGEIDDLRARAEARGVALYASWHSRAAPGVEPARAWLADRRIGGFRIAWKEDVRHWHPGQEWLFGPGGFGVFDPGINALSIATRILPAPLFVEAARLDVPENRDQPIAASLRFRTGDATGTAEFDFLHAGAPCWDIAVDTDRGTLRLRQGGAVLELPDGAPPLEREGEYPALYARFAGLAAGGRSDVDATPLRLVADAMLVARRVKAPAFDF